MSSFDSMLANWNSSIPYSFRCDSRISRREKTSPVVVRELPANDVLANALLAVDFDRTEMRQRARRRREARPCTWLSAGALLRDVDFRVRVAVVAQRVERALARRDGQLAIERLLRLQRQRVAQAPLLARRQHVEAGQIDPGDERRLPFRDPDDDVDLVLLVIQLDVEGADARVGESAIAIERLEPFEVGLERAAIEIGFVPPGQTSIRVWSGAPSASAFLSTCLTPWKSRLWIVDVALLAASREQRGQRGGAKGKTEDVLRAWRRSSPHAMPEQHAESRP